MNYLPARLAALLWLAVSVFLPSAVSGEMARQIAGLASSAANAGVAVGGRRR